MTHQSLMTIQLSHTCISLRTILTMTLLVILQAMNVQVIDLGTTTGKLASCEAKFRLKTNHAHLYTNLLVHNRCECGNCIPMPTPIECVCYKEITTVVNKCERMDLRVNHLPSSASLIMHDRFDPICLNMWVLQTAYFNYRHHYGTRDIGDIPTRVSF